MFSPVKLSILLFIASAANLFSISFYLHRREHKKIEEYSYRGHDYPENLPLYPPIGLVNLEAKEDSRFKLLGKASDDVWKDMTPGSGGYVRLGPQNRLFLVSMFHQFHCLRFFNWAFDPEFEGIYRVFATDDHSAHCLNYLRQSILCSPDLTLEEGDFVKHDFSSERAGVTHTCRDWSRVYEEMEQNWKDWNATIHLS